jgi:hypothetical protein
MIVTRGLGRSAVRVAIVAAGLCLGLWSSPTLPNWAYFATVSAEIRIQEEAVEVRTIVLLGEVRALVVSELARLAVVIETPRLAVVEA